MSVAPAGEPVETDTTTQGDDMGHRRLVGIDLGIASAHTVRVIDEAGQTIAKRKCWPTAESLGEVEAAALATTPSGTRLEVIMEPTGPAWLPIAVFFGSRGHLVYRVSSAKAADLRRFFSRHTKTNGIDADTLARLGLVDPAGLQPLELPGPGRRGVHRGPPAQSRPGRTGSPRRGAGKLLSLGRPWGLARSLPGLGEVGGPALVATMGNPARFRRGKAFRSFTGLAPRASETGDTDRKGQPMSKAGSSLLRTTLVRAADTARKQDPQLARIYYIQMVERGKDHLGALCVVAANLAERAWAVMDRGMPYVICDTDDTPVSAEQAKAIIAKRWTVPAEVRARRRSKRAGKAPKNVLGGQSKPGAQGAGERGGLPLPPSSALAS